MKGGGPGTHVAGCVGSSNHNAARDIFELLDSELQPWQAIEQDDALFGRFRATSCAVRNNPLQEKRFITPMDPRDSKPIATVDQFKAALLHVRDKEGITPKDIGIFKAFCNAPDSTLTAPKLAEAAGLATWHEANLRFGSLARYIAEALHFTPGKRKNGSLRWWQSASYGAEADEEETGYFQWTLRPELVEALRAMRWV